MLDKFYKITSIVGGWIRSLPPDKHRHIIGNTMLASVIAVISSLIGGDMLMAFVIVLIIGVVFEIVQAARGSFDLKDSLEDLAANAFGAGAVFLPWLVQ